MKDIIKELESLNLKCLQRGKLIDDETYIKALENIKNKDFSNESKKIAYIELYKYSYLQDIVTSIDRRGDRSVKFEAVNLLKEADNQENFDKAIKNIQSLMQSIKAYFENPLLIEEQSIKFFTEHPGARF